MAQVEFIYKGITTIIPCQRSQKMEEICNNFINKTKIKEKEIYYFYGGKGGAQFDKNLTFEQMANHLDKSRKKMSIVVQDNEVDNDDKSNTTLKNIICPECQNNIKMEIKNYKINLFECKNKHTTNNILFNEFEKTQTIDLTKIKCGICKEKDKSTTFNNEFYKCYDCNINLCPLCKTKHEKNHNVLNYDKINYICTEHNEQFTCYCKKCQINLCFMCEDQHYQHEIFSLAKMMKDKKELSAKLEELKKSKDILNENINKIITILIDVKEMFDMFYKLEENIFNNYNKDERNYELLYNINELINYNNIIKNDINLINNENNIRKKVDYILNIYEPKQEMKINNFSLILQKKYQKPFGLSEIYIGDKTGYINSVLQSFFNLKYLTKYLICFKDLFLTDEKSSPLLKSFIKIILNLSNKTEYSRGIKYELIEFYENLKKFKRFKDAQDEDTTEIILNLLELLNKDIFIIKKEESKVLYNFINYNSDFNCYLENNNINTYDFKNYIKEFISENKSIISNLFFFMIRSNNICPICHQSFSTFVFQKSIIFELEEIIAFKYSNPKNQIYSNNLSLNQFKQMSPKDLMDFNNPFNQMKQTNFMNPFNPITPKDLMYFNNPFNQMKQMNPMNPFNQIEPEEIMELLNIMNQINPMNSINPKILMNPISSKDLKDLMNPFGTKDLKNLKDLMNPILPKNLMYINNLKKLKNQIYLIDQILIIHFLMARKIPINSRSLIYQIYSNEPKSPIYKLNSFVSKNEWNFFEKKNIMLDRKQLDQFSVDLKDAFEYYKSKIYFGMDDQDRCKNCFKANYIMMNSFFTLPKYLIINLNKSNKNLEVKFTFPEIIDLKEEVQYNLDSQVYRLICAITRAENINNHYISFSYLEDQKKWYKFDDHQVRETTFNEVSSLGRGICNLIYEKIDL